MQRLGYGGGHAVRLCLQTSDGKPVEPLIARDPGSALDSRKEIPPERLYAVIDVQRETLAGLDSLLGCLAIAMEYGSEVERPPYFPDVVQMARDLVQQSARSLDPLTLQTRVKNKVREEPWMFSPRSNRDSIHAEAV